MIQIGEKKQYYSRLEDCIRIAREGTRVEMEVELKKLPVIQEVHIMEGDVRHDKIQTYLLIAYYTFKFADQVHRLSKVYMFATQEESLDSLRVNKEIANNRLKMDYNRLKEAHIHFHEKYF